MTSTPYYAEEVQLPRGERACALTSTTGRRLRVVACSSSSASGSLDDAYNNKTTSNNNNDNNNSNNSNNNNNNATTTTSSRVGTTTVTTTTANCSSSVMTRRAVTAPTTTSRMTPSQLTLALTCVDMYGFCVTLHEKAAEDAQRRRGRAEEQRRVSRWRALLQRWRASHNDVAERKELCRDGIPPALRPTAWQWLLGTLDVDGRLHVRGADGGSGSGRALAYAQLCATPLRDDALAAVIDRDLARTFPTHRLFDNSRSHSVGQAMLRRVLRAYAVRNVEVGYVQGMSFLAATLLVQLEREVDAFWALCALMEHPPYQLQQLYLPGFPQLHCACYVLERLLRRVHRPLYRRLKRAQVPASVYATQWFLTLFAYSLNFALLARIWDMFLCEGWKPIYRVALAFLVRGARRLLTLRDDGECILVVRSLQDEQDAAAVLRTAQDIEMTTAQMQRYERRYWKQQAAQLLQQQQQRMTTR